MCSICGHEGHHNKAQCEIKDPSNDGHLRQWTKSKFDEYMKKNPKRRYNFVVDPYQATGSQDPTEQLETELPITPFNYTAPAPTPELAQKLAWARESYGAVPF
ncbi:hypothetical protein IFR04_014359 [Cadophora malorum]|uniref:Uncharacterized protein n=1 Tax=Cadophora malorum TaxID=108018 RepID=A0A8H7T598_9HELO|nr:hypothetical protein IFR04_014359 [Cadophora malorum]